MRGKSTLALFLSDTEEDGKREKSLIWKRKLKNVWNIGDTLYMEIFWLSKVLCVDFEMFMFGAEQWSGWLGAKVRKKGMMRKFFILKEQKKQY